MSRILLVDDEPNILAALKRELLRIASGLTVISTTSPLEGLDMARRESFDFVISDYKMPEMDGVAFLKAFQDIQHDVICLMLSGQVDQDHLLDAINCTHIFRFIAKPWSEPELAEVLAQVRAYRLAEIEHGRLANMFRERYGAPAHIYEPDKRYQVLVVDDEPNVLSAVSRTLNNHNAVSGLFAGLRRKSAPALERSANDLRFIVESCQSPQAALECARQVSFDLVIADYLMPGMDGIQFLDAFRKIQPDAVRLMLSGQADMSVLTKAINQSEIFAFITKPWSESQLRSVVAQAVAFHDLLGENRRLAERLAHKHGA